MKKQIEISGPYYEFFKPYGTFVTCERDVWYVKRKLSAKELKSDKASECSKITGERMLGSIVRPRKHNRSYVIDQLFPRKAFNSLKKAINFLTDNEGKLVFCT